MKKLVLVAVFVALFFSFVGDYAMAEEFPELEWTGSSNVEAGQVVQGPAIIEKHDRWVKVNFGEEYTLSENGHANFYTGNQAGLDAEYLRTIRSGSYTVGDVNSDGLIDVRDVVLLSRYILGLEDLSAEQLTAADINGDGLIDVRDVALLSRHILGLAEIVSPIAPEEPEVPEFPELEWTGSSNVEAGQVVQGPAIIEKHDRWVKVNFGEEYTLSENGHANFYTGNQAGLDAEYARTIAE